MSLTGKYTLSLRATESATAPLSGGTSAVTLIEQVLTDGTTANKADLAHKATVTVPATDNVDVDLRALLGLDGAALSTLTEVVALVLEATPANAATVAVKPSASNGWLGLLADATDVLNLAAGATVALLSPADGKYAVGASAKSINFANAGASACTVNITLIGRSA